MSAQRQIGVAHQVNGEAVRQLELDAPVDEYLAQLLLFLLGVGDESLTLHLDLRLQELLLRLHRKVLAASHGESPGDQARQSGQSNDTVPRVGAGEAQYQRYVGDETIAYAKDRGAKPTARYLSMVHLVVLIAHRPILWSRRRGRRRGRRTVEFSRRYS